MERQTMARERTGDYEVVYDPRGTVAAEAASIAARPRKLAGLRLAVLDNTKWNANKLLRRSMQRLNDEFGLSEINYYRKESFSKVAAPELIREIVGKNDIVLTAIGD
jgi:hypothetical protein